MGVYQSFIHGLGLFCRRDIDAGEMVIEYAGTVIRSVLTDKREKMYDAKVKGWRVKKGLYIYRYAGERNEGGKCRWK